MFDPEFRVRNQVGALLKVVLSSSDDERNLYHFKRIKEMLIDNIEKTFERDQKHSENSKILIDQKNDKRMHDTEGWKSLDTSMNCLKSLIEAICKKAFTIDLSEVLAVIMKSALHINRFVRDIAFQIINVLLDAAKDNIDAKDKEFYEVIVPLIPAGLNDIWP
jgi:hypothetical protein